MARPRRQNYSIIVVFSSPCQSAIWYHCLLRITPTMQEKAILVEGLGKRYRLGVSANSHRTLAEGFSRFIRHPLTSLGWNQKKDFLWALKDLSLEIKRGEV